ncbi:E3 ubiquitin-protein ligase hrd1 [Exophiala dermatitidis]|uniref:RING-type E3 ubiquitin transferase n=2 Tax=Exophiala dermatitidis TaxID=5970 RepID=H6C6U1_EXODN|nr:E3 ubiquitin-protein ligase synoviolin [Exophiala dermatitidis NIH/UT8656]KAJ4522793.1 E3 ubiquitin-protein ligase hrd1 [Exophiala dermatitidis]EHY59437.1 E3 ubiquitin-protein ligase synoviolin [Exophiala dermatitidis NIH/UT8656]KAJ4526101.1 E3 ubiquitin-protein ligase hrd1 [Exophiala dermatitidis]KAJ4526955.1 E3 ubiquitin-protein ligase hrd1 [Exophiala dermatitidis]KAJ4532669.1 E3 ubiquitin-protein ligase hrd1 [Exophiala dermatitidis]
MPVRMRMRWTAYAGASTALAAGVILKALAQRPNFYSAAVYLSQSSANLMILTNLLFVVACTFFIGLQKLLYGSLRPIEIEQLYEKAWFAVTETCLAMTVFRGEVGLGFLAMFFALLTGKVWGWIGEGRVEILEQQPPRNPRLFHTRLALSLGLSVAFDLTMLEYVVKQVMRMARPDMMVMFGFEFAVLSITSISTAIRYAIDLVEIGIVREQKRQRIEEIKRERVQAAVSELQQAQNAPAEGAAIPSDAQAASLPTPTQRTVEQVSQEVMNQPVDENEVEVEGWEDKGRYMFYLNLATDFFKLVIYLAFFFILLVFYGLPIHILRDVFITMRSFVKRISDFRKYRAATRDMNARYPDATEEDIGPEDVCIICREEMRPYQPPAAQDGQPAPRGTPVAERMRPKKLPCGHVLHFSCLRSWLERQQICPTCRANVVQGGRTGPNGRAAGQPGAAGGDDAQGRPDGRQGPRIYQFGPLRIGVGAVRGQNVFEELQQQLREVRQAGVEPPAHGDANAPRQFGVGIRWAAGRRPRPGDQNQNMTTREQLDALRGQLDREMQDLAHSSAELSLLRSMQTEMQRLRDLRPGEAADNASATGPGTGTASGTTPAPASNATPAPAIPPAPIPGQQTINPSPFPRVTQTLSAGGPHDVIFAGSDRLPPGLTLPEGWCMMPLRPTQFDAARTMLPPHMRAFGSAPDVMQRHHAAHDLLFQTPQPFPHPITMNGVNGPARGQTFTTTTSGPQPNNLPEQHRPSAFPGWPGTPDLQRPAGGPGTEANARPEVPNTTAGTNVQTYGPPGSEQGHVPTSGMGTQTQPIQNSSSASSIPSSAVPGVELGQSRPAVQPSDSQHTPAFPTTQQQAVGAALPNWGTGSTGNGETSTISQPSGSGSNVALQNNQEALSVPREGAEWTDGARIPSQNGGGNDHSNGEINADRSMNGIDHTGAGPPPNGSRPQAIPGGEQTHVGSSESEQAAPSKEPHHATVEDLVEDPD